MSIKKNEPRDNTKQMKNDEKKKYDVNNNDDE